MRAAEMYLSRRGLFTSKDKYMYIMRLVSNCTTLGQINVMLNMNQMVLKGEPGEFYIVFEKIISKRKEIQYESI